MRIRHFLLPLVLSGIAFGTDQPPQVSADVGPCTAEFTVTDTAHTPLYDARIKTTVRYGFLSKRKVELEIGTDANGKARITGLPHDVKKPLAFALRYKGMAKSINHDPATNCHANFEVALRAEK